MYENEVVQLSLPIRIYRMIEATAHREQQTSAEVVAKAVERYVQLAGSSPLVGLFADEPELLDGVSEDAMRTREGSQLHVC